MFGKWLKLAAVGMALAAGALYAPPAHALALGWEPYDYYDAGYYDNTLNDDWFYDYYAYDTVYDPYYDYYYYGAYGYDYDVDLFDWEEDGLFE